MPVQYDVIVVGAGPSGSIAARHAAESGARTLFIDKRKTIGVPVQCGEFIPTNGELKRLLPHAQEIDSVLDEDIIEPFIRKRTHAVTMVSPRWREYTFEFEGYTVDRDLFDRCLAELAEDAGALLMNDTRFKNLKGNTVYTTRGDFTGKVIIAADGPHSLVCREAGLPAPEILAPALTCQVKGDYGDRVRMYFGKENAPGGFAWIIPKGDCANVGLGVQNSRLPPHILLARFLKERKMRTKKINAGFIPISGPVDTTVQGSVISVGDAAGHVMATNGGGIPVAMICGRLAGITAAEHALDGKPLLHYDKTWREHVGKELGTAAKSKRLADKFFKADFLLELAMKRLGADGLKRVASCGKTFGKK